MAMDYRNPQKHNFSTSSKTHIASAAKDDFYFLDDASKRLAERDEDDVEPLALSLKLKIPVWSNNRHFQRSGVKTYSTANGRGDSQSFWGGEELAVHQRSY